MEEDKKPIKGRGAQINPKNVFEKTELNTTDFSEMWEEPIDSDEKTEFFEEFPKKVVNKVPSPDVGAEFSLNPYQGCEHGCVYCFARNTHQYWGFSAGLDFERKIMIKKNAPEILRKTLDNPKWQPSPIMLSGNTDCYQPIERKLKITRQILEFLLEYKHPVGIITKNSLILRDTDILAEMSALDLIHVNVSITSLDENLRLALEPRTTTATQRFRIVEKLSALGIPVNVMTAPIIPGRNDHEIPALVKMAADKGATSVAYTMVRLNGPIGEIFTDWIKKTFPDKAFKVLSQIAEVHGGQLNDSRFGTRMRGEGPIAKAIRDLFYLAKNKHFKDRIHKPYNLTHFKRPQKGQLKLFDF